MANRSYDPHQALANIDSLTFACVQRTIPSTDSQYYYGFAQSNNTSIWFNRTSRTDSLHVGPVSLRQTDCTPRRRTWIAGETEVVALKGPSFKWWFSDAGPLMELRRRLRHNAGRKRGGRRMHDMLGGDDMYVLARVLVYGDIHLLVEQLINPTEKMEIHPQRKKCGHVLQRGYKLQRHPVIFAALASHFAGCPAILQTFNKLLELHAVDDETKRLSNIYSEQVLKFKLQTNCNVLATSK